MSPRTREAWRPTRRDKGTFDVLFEASGNEAALRGALDALRPGGIIVQLGLGGEMKLPINTLVAKELQLRGTFRFDEEFRLAVELMGKPASSTSSRCSPRPCRSSGRSRPSTSPRTAPAP